jgi:2,4-dienoyl-CoA reductase-like NADH-dependent reductase (Old Yellow Enzyme family)/thioredoxin reductase
MVSAHAHPFSGDITPELIRFIGMQAGTGVGLVTIGATPVDFDRGRDFIGCMSVVKDYDVPLLRLITEEAHRYGAKISAELLHAGPVAHPLCLQGKKAFVPWLTPGMDPEHFEQINEAQMMEVISHFQDAARRLKDSQFDMVMIHAAHGNLLSSFLSGVTNRRNDKYGGSVENRMRFPLMVAKSLRETVGSRMGLDIRISSCEYVEGSPSLDDIVTFLNAASDYIDCAHISGGLITDPRYVRYSLPSYYRERNLNVERAAYIKSRIGIPITVVGNIPDIEAAEVILAEGKADMVAMGRNLLADPEMIHKTMKEKSEKIRRCLHCQECIRLAAQGSPLRCSVNPALGREIRYSRIEPAQVYKKVLIVGGGPAGMMAAQTAAKRGHNVALYEKNGYLGGHMLEASVLEYKDYHRKYLSWDVEETMNCGAKIMLNTAANVSLVEREKPDVLIIATGADYLLPPIPGLSNALSITDVEILKKPIGKRVVLCGGGFSAAECAVQMALRGHDCVCIDKLPEDQLHLDVCDMVKEDLRAEMDRLNIDLIDHASITNVGVDSVSYVKNGKEATIPCDSVIAAMGMKPNQQMIDSLSSLVPETYIIGDAKAIGNIRTANHDGFNVAVEI